MSSPKISFIRLLLLAFLVNFLSQAIHETGHLLAYQAYGRKPTWGFIGLVQVWGTQPVNPGAWVKTSTPEGEIGWLKLGSLPTDQSEIAIVGAAGPLASLFFAIESLWLTHKYKKREVVFKYLSLMLALSISLVMALYYLRSPFRIIGDEYDVVTYFGVAKFVVEIPLALIFVAGLLFGLRFLDSWRTRLAWLAAAFLGGLLSGLLVNVLDGAVRDSVNKGLPLFQPVLGYSMPVLAAHFLALLCIFWWARNTRKVLRLFRAMG